MFGVLKGGTRHAVPPWLKITLCDSTGSGSKTSCQVTAIPASMCLGIMGLDRTGLYRSFSTMAVFWASLSGVRNDLPRFLLHNEVIFFVSNTFSEWHCLTALQIDVRVLFIHSSNGQSHLTILSELILIRNSKMAAHSTAPVLFRLTSCCFLRAPGLGSFPQLTP